MKILYVIHQFSEDTFAGVEVYTFDLARQMAKKGHQVSLLAMSNKSSTKNRARQLKSGFTLVKIKDSKKQLVEFKKLLADSKPDLIHFQHLQYFSPRLITLARASSIPMILNLHDYYYICKRLRLLTKEGRLCNSIRHCSGCQKRRLAWRKRIKDIDLVLANSHSTRNLYIKAGFEPGKIMVNYPGVDVVRIRGVKHVPSNILRFGFLGTLIKEKGVEILIEAFNRLDNSVSLEIWGRGDAYATKLKSLIKKPNIEIKGEYRISDLRAIFKNLDIVIIPSLWPETWSIVKTEALAAGLTVLASSIGGLSEAMPDRGVLFFKPNSVSSLVESIKAVLESKNLWKIKARPKVAVKTIEQDAHLLQKLYAALIKKSHSGSESKRYIVNSKLIDWIARDGYIEIYKLDELGKFIYKINGVGQRCWQLLTSFYTLGQTADILARDYKTSYEEVKADISAFIEGLRKKEILIEV